MSQLCSSANQYGKQQCCEYGRMSTVCPFCVKTQTQQTDFFIVWIIFNQLAWKNPIGRFLNSFLIASLRIDEWWIFSQNHNLANLFLVVQSTNSISSRGQKTTFWAGTLAIFVLKVLAWWSMQETFFYCQFATAIHSLLS